MVLQCLDKCGRFIDIYLSKRQAVRPLVCQLINFLPLYIVSTGCQLSYFKCAQAFTLILFKVISNKTHILGIRNNKDFQALMSSMRQETEENEYISSLSRGGLWAPHEWIVRIAEVSELTFRKNTNKDNVTCLPVDTIVNEGLASPLVQSMWSNIIQNCDGQISKECHSLCLENVVKLYICYCQIFFIC